MPKTAKTETQAQALKIAAIEPKLFSGPRPSALIRGKLLLFLSRAITRDLGD
jgi:hypothetical protein